jgi:hypothetical protein
MGPIRVLVAYEVTSQRNAQNILRLKKCTHGQRLIVTVANFQMYRGGSEELDKHKKCVLEKNSSSANEAEYNGDFKCHHRKKSKGFRSTRCWAVPRNLLADVHRYEHVSRFVVRNSLL